MKVGITGHQNIPEQAEPLVREVLEQLLAEQGEPLTCATSLAEGADQMCAGLVLKAGGRLHAVVPCTGYEKSFGTAAAAERFRSLLEKSSAVETLPFPRPSDEAFLAAGRRVVDLSELLIAVWDGGPSRGKGGTADIVEYAQRRGVRVKVIWPPGLAR
jgi:hypothetical protein